MSAELESQVNEILLKNGWDYDARKRVTFMLRNKRPHERTLDEAIKAVLRAVWFGLVRILQRRVSRPRIAS